MFLEHLSTLTLKENEPDGLQIAENLLQMKRHFCLVSSETKRYCFQFRGELFT